jgi:hypothetical protein
VEGTASYLEPKRELLFKILLGIGGHEFVAYTDGSIEGFGEGAIVFNHHPTILAKELARQQVTIPGLRPSLEPVRWGCPEVGDYYLHGSGAILRRTEGQDTAIPLYETLIVAAAPGYAIVNIGGLFAVVRKFTEPIALTIRATVRDEAQRDVVQDALHRIRDAGVPAKFEVRGGFWDGAKRT